MIKVVDNMKNIKDSNLVFLVESKECLEKLSLLDLDKVIIDNILSIIEKKENTMLHFYIGRKNISSIFVILYLDKNKRNLYELLWEYIVKVPNKMTLMSNNKDNLLPIIDSCLLSRYKFQNYLSEKKEDDINIVCEEKYKKKVEERLETLNNIIMVRDLWETPTSDLSPQMFVKKAKEIKWKNTKIKVLWPKEVEKEWLWLLWAVWKWSINKAQMIILERIIDKKLPTIWLVWKWIVFDTWWLNLKPEKWLYPMKDDMCWAATVLAIMKELDKKDLKVNIICCIPLAENAVSGEAYRPSDILKAYNGKTVNVINTDAEWRLILADWISYISKNYKLDRVITVATLTWACLYALWFRYAWIMWDDREMIDSLLKYTKTNFEKYMELPFDNYYIEKTKSEIADYDNLREWIFAWSTMWGAFLYNFLLNNEKFTHIDIAGVANNSYEPYGLYTKSVTWFWVDSLSKLLLSLK